MHPSSAVQPLSTLPFKWPPDLLIPSSHEDAVMRFPSPFKTAKAGESATTEESLEENDMEPDGDYDESFSDFPETQPAFSQTQPSSHPKPSSQQLKVYAVLIPTNPSRNLTPCELQRNNNLPYTFGRVAQMVDFVIPGKRVSAVHCRIWRDGSDDDPNQRILVEDCSSNGLWVENTKLGRGKKTVLESGNEISFGPPTTNFEEDYRYIFRIVKKDVPYEIDMNAAGGLYQLYDVRDAIGKGSFATVKRAIHRETGQFRAVKVIQKKRFINNPKTFRMLEREVEIMKSLKHPHIVQYEDYFEDDDTMFLVMEFVDGGDLLDYAIRKDGLSEESAAEIARQICLAVTYLHEQGVCHRDLKPDNVLLTRGESPIIKVSDFGLAKMVDNQTFLKTACGTPTYLAPEVVLQAKHQGYSFAVDAWSIGVIVYAIISNSSPFDEDERQPLDERMRQRSPDYNLLLDIGISDTAIDFIRQLLTFDPRTRMTPQQALRHPWLNEARMRHESSGSLSLLPPNEANLNGRVPASASTSDITSADTTVKADHDMEEDNSYSQKLGQMQLNGHHNDTTTNPMRKTVSPAAPLRMYDPPSATELVPSAPLTPAYHNQFQEDAGMHVDHDEAFVSASSFPQNGVLAEETQESQPFQMPLQKTPTANGKRKMPNSTFSDDDSSPLSELSDSQGPAAVDSPAATTMDEDEKEDSRTSRSASTSHSRRTSVTHPSAKKTPVRKASAKAAGKRKSVGDPFAMDPPEGRRTSARTRKQARKS